MLLATYSKCLLAIHTTLVLQWLNNWGKVRKTTQWQLVCSAAVIDFVGHPSHHICSRLFQADCPADRWFASTDLLMCQSFSICKEVWKKTPEIRLPHVFWRYSWVYYENNHSNSGKHGSSHDWYTVLLETQKIKCFFSLRQGGEVHAGTKGPSWAVCRSQFSSSSKITHKNNITITINTMIIQKDHHCHNPHHQHHYHQSYGCWMLFLTFFT